MKIIQHQLMTEADTLARLKKTRLRGFGQPEVYKDPATLEVVQDCYPMNLFPSQNYVIKSGVNDIIEIYDYMYPRGVDIFHLTGALLFWQEGDETPTPLLPPIVEESFELEYTNPLWLINDGLHRCYAARNLGKRINVILARNVPREYPYYAYPLAEQWHGVREVDEAPKEGRKAYRNPEDYKALFRDFNAVFNGIQKKRV